MNITKDMIIQAAKKNGVGLVYTKHYDGRSDIKVFISSLKLGKLEDLKKKLLEMQQRGEILLSRFDMPSILKKEDRHLAIDSMTEHMGSTFHFVMVPEAATAVSR